MKKLKYIKRIFENFNSSKVLSISGMNVTILNPDGKEVSIDMEDDGEYEEIVDYHDVDISVSGEDEKYRYSMSASTDRHRNYIEISSTELEVELLSDINAREEKRKVIDAKWSEDNKIKIADEEARIQKEIKDSGLSKADFNLERNFKNENKSNSYNQSNIDPESSVILIELEDLIYDEDGKVDDVIYRLIKYPIPPNPLDDRADDYDELMDFFGLIDMDKIKDDIRGLYGMLRRGTKIKSIKYPREFDDPREFIKRSKWYSDLSDII